LEASAAGARVMTATSSAGLAFDVRNSWCRVRKQASDSDEYRQQGFISTY